MPRGEKTIFNGESAKSASQERRLEKKKSETRYAWENSRGKEQLRQCCRGSEFAIAGKDHRPNQMNPR
jgi:hypothetical protein